MLLTHKRNCRRWMSYSIERTSRVRFPPMTSRYRIILHLVLDSGLILTIAKIFELVFFLLSTEPDVTGRTNETFRVVNEMLAMIAVSPFPFSMYYMNPCSHSSITSRDRADWNAWERRALFQPSSSSL